MCDQCGEMEGLLISDNINLELIQKLVDDGKIDLYARNCNPNELSEYLDRGNHYTMNTYYHCKKCNKYYYVGFCLYGNPLIEEVDSQKILDDILRLEWGYVGTYFKNGLTMKDAKYALQHAAYIIAPVWSCLMDAFGDGTVISMLALTKTLKVLYQRVQKDGAIELKYPDGTEDQIINNETFDGIIQKYFSESVLHEIKR